MHLFAACTTALLIQALLTAATARADFTIRADSPGAAMVSDEPRLSPGDRERPGALHARPRRSSSGPAVARGFGDGVPLAFACRQIVPSSVQVAYGPGVDPNASISWRGGRAWPDVLASAIRPLGLHVALSGSRLLIRQ